MTTTNLIKYNGESYPEHGISNGMELNDVVSILLNKIKSITDSKVQIGAGVDKELSYGDAIKSLADTFGKIDSSSITHKQKGYFENQMSYEAISLMDLKMPYSLNVSGAKMYYIFDYSLINTISNIRILSSRTKLFGEGQQGILYQDSNSISGTISFDIDKLPVYIDTQITCVTDFGDIVLSNVFRITSAFKTEGSIIFDVKDYTYKEKSMVTISDWSDYITKKVDQVYVLKDQILKYQISGTKNLPNQKGLTSTISNLYGIVDDVLETLSNVDKVSVPGLGNSINIGQACNLLNDKIEGQQLLINSCLSSIESINTEINNLSGYYSNIVNNLSGGTFNQVGGSVGSNDGDCVNCGEDTPGS